MLTAILLLKENNHYVLVVSFMFFVSRNFIRENLDHSPRKAAKPKLFKTEGYVYCFILLTLFSGLNCVD